MRWLPLLLMPLTACVTETLTDDGGEACVRGDAPDKRYTFERNTTSDAILYWGEETVRCIPMASSTAGTDQIDNEVAVLRRAIDTWNGALESCPAAACLRYGGPLSDAEGFGLDQENPYKNLVTYVGDRQVWNTRHPDTLPNPPVALTTLFSTADGEIFDADIEVNTGYFRFTTGGSMNALDLESVLVHELGHVLGFDHNNVNRSVMQAQLEPGARQRRVGPTDVEGACAAFACY